MVGCGDLGVIVERFAYRPLRDAPRIAPLISALGLSFFIANSALLIFGAARRLYESYNFEDGSTSSRASNWGPLNVSVFRILTISLAIVLCITRPCSSRARASARRCGRRLRP